MNNVERQRLYEDYKEIKLSYQNVVEANTKLVNENQYLTLDKEILQHRIDKAIEMLDRNISNHCDLNILEQIDLLDILRGDKDGFYN